jgi:hypothetical protein
MYNFVMISSIDRDTPRFPTHGTHPAMTVTQSNTQQVCANRLTFSVLTTDDVKDLALEQITCSSSEILK